MKLNIPVYEQIPIVLLKEDAQSIYTSLIEFRGQKLNIFTAFVYSKQECTYKKLGIRQDWY